VKSLTSSCQTESFQHEPVPEYFIRSKLLPHTGSKTKIRCVEVRENLKTDLRGQTVQIWEVPRRRAPASAPCNPLYFSFQFLNAPEHLTHCTDTGSLSTITAIIWRTIPTLFCFLQLQIFHLTHYTDTVFFTTITNIIRPIIWKILLHLKLKLSNQTRFNFISDKLITWFRYNLTEFVSLSISQFHKLCLCEYKCKSL